MKNIVLIIIIAFSAIEALSANDVVYTIDGADVTLTFTVRPPPIATVYERNMVESDKIVIRRVWL